MVFVAGVYVWLDMALNQRLLGAPGALGRFKLSYAALQSRSQINMDDKDEYEEDGIGPQLRKGACRCYHVKVNSFRIQDVCPTSSS